MKEQGLAFDCFEKGSDIFGMWHYDSANGRSSCYASLHIDTSRPIPDLVEGRRSAEEPADLLFCLELGGIAALESDGD